MERQRTGLHRGLLHGEARLCDRGATRCHPCFNKDFPWERFRTPRRWPVRRRIRRATRVDDGGNGRTPRPQAVREYCLWRYGQQEVKYQ